MLDSIEYLPKKNEFNVGDVKNLAVSTNQKDDMSKMYPKLETSTLSNADMLSQSFSGNAPMLEIPKEDALNQTVNEPVQVSEIPNIQNSFNMESNPVDLNPNPSLDHINESVPVIESQNSNNSVNSQVNDSLEDNVKLETASSIPVVESINPVNINNNSIESGFKVSSEPNIFDNPSTPFEISQEEINKPIENVSLHSENFVSSTGTDVPENNIFTAPTIISNEETQEEVVSDSINEDIILAQIAIEESNVKHYEALAENSKKKIELLKRQVKNSKKEVVNLENTASNLFNNNGVLDEEKVLGKTHMSNIMTA